ncbi:MAG: Ribonuclease [Candidatus Parcubacteria bacterium]|jgi:ribonuclease P protein component
MLKKADRVSRTDFESHLKGGKRFHCDYATLIFQPSKTFQGSVVVSKKVSKKAVERNTIRRRIYAMLYTQKKADRVGVYMVMVKPPYQTLTKQAAQAQMKQLIERATKSA